MVLIFYLCLCTENVTLESNKDICMQNNTLEYDNRFYGTYDELATEAVLANNSVT